MAEAVQAASVPAMVEVSTDIYFICGAACICALQSGGSFVLVSVRNPLTRAALSVSVQLSHRHDGASMLEQGWQRLRLGNLWQRCKDTLMGRVVVRWRALVYNADPVSRFQGH